LLRSSAFAALSACSGRKVTMALTFGFTRSIRAMKARISSVAEILRLLRRISATELMRAFIARIERVNPKVNAIVTFLPEQALKAAKALDRAKSLKGPLA